MEFKYDVFADYFQFALEDDNAVIDTKGIWTDQEVQDRLVARHNFLAIGTARNMVVPVTIEILEEPITSEVHEMYSSAAQHVAEGSFTVQSGRIVIFGDEYYPESPRISVKPGTYHARIYYCNLDSLRENGLEGDDSYRVVLYPGENIEPQVLKRHPFETGA